MAEDDADDGVEEEAVEDVEVGSEVEGMGAGGCVGGESAKWTR